MILCLLNDKPEIISKLFNHLLKKPTNIEKWNTSIICPIYKTGDKSIPDNYRGISLSSCLLKFFCSILNQRLLKYVVENNILSKSQLGFVPGNKTSDALLILYNLIDYHCHKLKDYLFGCFVDFSKAFDTIPRKRLFQKLLDLNINGKFYDSLKNLYIEDKVCIKIDNEITNNFLVNRGVKQGCILSPLLFNIFLSDLQEKLDSPENTPATFCHSRSISCLIWADDIILLSKTESGLKKMLETLDDYVKENGMKINIKKTKVMIFNKTGRHIRRIFPLGDKFISTCCEYKYLGFQMTPYGGITTGLKDLKDRGLKAFFKIKNQLGPAFAQYPKVTIKLFDSLIKPILLYASDFWGALKLPKNNPIEVLQMKFYKSVLGVQKQTTNNGVLLELGQIPITITAIKNAIKNWTKISNIPEHKTLVSSSYQYNITENLSWSKQIKNLLSSNGMLDQYQTKGTNTHKNVFQRLSDNFHQSALSQIENDSSKLRTYSLLKTSLGYEDYLDEVKNTKHRISLTKLRLSNHSLMIEKGRHLKINKNLRHCPFCPNIVEDEMHFLVTCKTYHKLRCPKLQSNLSLHTIDNEIERRTFVKILSDKSNIKEIAASIYKMFQCREFLIKNPRNNQ